MALDAGDPLARWRDEFLIPDQRVAYLDGNSLGMTPRRTIERRRGADARRMGRRADPLLGPLGRPAPAGRRRARRRSSAPARARSSSTTRSRSTCTNSCTPRSRCVRIGGSSPSTPATSRPTATSSTASPGRPVARCGTGSNDSTTSPSPCARSSTTAPPRSTTSPPRPPAPTAAGALLIWDLSHAAGLLDVDLHAGRRPTGRRLHLQVPQRWAGLAGVHVRRRRLHRQIDQPIWGWFSQVDQFAMGTDYTPRPDVGRLLARHAGDHRPHRCRGRHRAVRRGRDRGDRRQGTRAHRLRARPVRSARARLTQPDRSDAPRRPLLGEAPRRGVDHPHARRRPRRDHRLPRARPDPARLLAADDPFHRRRQRNACDRTIDRSLT